MGVDCSHHGAHDKNMPSRMVFLIVRHVFVTFLVVLVGSAVAPKCHVRVHDGEYVGICKHVGALHNHEYHATR